MMRGYESFSVFGPYLVSSDDSMRKTAKESFLSTVGIDSQKDSRFYQDVERFFDDFSNAALANNYVDNKLEFSISDAPRSCLLEWSNEYFVGTITVNDHFDFIIQYEDAYKRLSKRVFPSRKIALDAVTQRDPFYKENGNKYPFHGKVKKFQY